MKREYISPRSACKINRPEPDALLQDRLEHGKMRAVETITVLARVSRKIATSGAGREARERSCHSHRRSPLLVTWRSAESARKNFLRASRILKRDRAGAVGADNLRQNFHVRR